MKCPGQDSRYWDGNAIYEVSCPQCGNTEEFFKDESSRKCKKCGHRMVNPRMDFGCASYCKFADQCIGELPDEIIKQRDDLLRDRVAIKMRMYFGNDFKRIEHANKVAEYAEKIAREKNADLAVVLSAAYLHDIGIKEAEKKYGSAMPEFQELEGQPVAREILKGLNADDSIIDEVCDIISHHHHPRENDSDNFISVYDADQIVIIKEDYLNNGGMDREELSLIIEKKLLSDSGKVLAKQVLFKE